MADENKTQTYVWPVELRENKITEQTDDYTASVKTFNDTKTMEDVARDITRERTEYRLDTSTSKSSWQRRYDTSSIPAIRS